MKRGTQITICPECKTVTNMNSLKRKELDGGIEEVGIECRNCGEWQHLYWLNQELKAMQTENPTRKERRVYEHRFNKFQRKMEKKRRVTK